MRMRYDLHLFLEVNFCIFTFKAPEKQPYLARLGVNVLLWAGSKQVVKHLHRVMEGQTSSSRHKMFLNKQEREECCR